MALLRTMRMTCSTLQHWHAITVALLCLGSPSAWSTGLYVDDADLEPGEVAIEPSVVIAPFIFYSDYTQGGVGAIGVWSGYGQPQQSFVSAVISSKNDSKAAWFYSNDTKLPFGDRLFLDSEVHWAWWRNVDAYRDGNPNFTDERAGSNESSQDNFVRTTGEENYLRLKFKYVLPLADGADSGLHRYRFKDGILIRKSRLSRGSWNPLRSGRTIISAQLFQQRHLYDESESNQYEASASGIHWALDYDNTDVKEDPSEGSRTKLKLSRDWGNADSDGGWTRAQLSLAKYLDFGASKYARKQVLALNFWTSDVTSWSDNKRPPNFERSYLGGYKRLRSYPLERFNDRSAIYYAAEYRYTPKWNPLPNLPLLDLLPYFHWHWVIFAEVGRVNDSYNLSTLHQAMKWSLGAAFRASIKGAVGSIDIAYGGEGAALSLSAQHPF